MIKFIDSEDDIYKILNSNLQEKDAETVVLYVRLKEYPEKTVEQIKDCVDKYLQAGYIPHVKIDSNDFVYNVNDFESFIDIEEYVNKRGVGLSVAEGACEYTLDETLTAWVKCRDYVGYLKSLDASPFEKYLMIYRYLTSFIYKENSDVPMHARQIIPVLSSDEIVCVGYSKLLQYFCNEIGIKCEVQQLGVDNEINHRSGMHQNNVVYIKDAKYGIDGYYYADACWDSIKKNREPFLNYNYALLPLSDVNCFDGKKLRIFGGTEIFYSDDVLEDMLVSRYVCDKLAEVLNFKYRKEPLPDYFKSKNQRGSRIVDAAKQLKDIFLSEGVPSDYLSIKKHSSYPRCFYPEFLMAMLLREPPEMDVVNYYIGEIKRFVDSGWDDGKPRYARMFHAYGYDDIYAEFDKYVQGDFNFNTWDIMEYYENYDYFQQIRSTTESVRWGSTPITIDMFELAIKNSLMAEGWDDKASSVQAKRSVDLSIRRAGVIFNDQATNCFTQENKKEKVLMKHK